MNPHERNAHYALNVARLPVPPLRLFCLLEYSIKSVPFVNPEINVPVFSHAIMSAIMEMIAESILSIVVFLSTPSGLALQSIVIIFLVISSLSLLNAVKNQISKKDLQRARISFLVVLILNVCAACAYFLNISDLLPIPESFYEALHQFVWCLNLILIGWLWIPPYHYERVKIFQRIFAWAAVAFFFFQAFQFIEWMVSPFEVLIPYPMIWRVFEFTAGIFLFFLYIPRFKEISFPGFVFLLLQIFGLGADEIFIISPQFSQMFSQLLAFLVSTQVFLVMEFNPVKQKNASPVKPVILSENMTVIPDSALANAWLQTTLVNDTSLLPFSFCKALSLTLCADCCLILEIKKLKSEFKLVCGYSTHQKKQILPQAVLLNEDIVIQNKSVLFHQSENFPHWIKAVIQKTHHTGTLSALYIPVPIENKEYVLLFSSTQDQWSEPHLTYLKEIMPGLVQILHAYFGEEHLLLPENKPEKTSSNPFLDLMRSEIDHTKDIQEVEAELQLALEEYNRIRKILEERGIGQ